MCIHEVLPFLQLLAGLLLARMCSLRLQISLKLLKLCVMRTQLLFTLLFAGFQLCKPVPSFLKLLLKILVLL